MNAPASTPGERLPQRGLRFAALLLQTILATPLLLLLILTALPAPEFGFGSPPIPAWEAALVLGLGPVLLFVGLLLASWRLQARSWLRIGLGYVALAAVLAYLAHDDPTVRHPLTLEELSPPFPGAEASYAVLMRYGKAQPLGRNFKAPNCPVAGELARPTALAQWRDALHAHRAELEANWAALAPVRAWWNELSAFDRIGDLTPARADADIPAFQPLRSVSQHGVAIARLQALDGRGDDAIETLLPILQVGRKLQANSRTLVRSMMAIVIERMSLQTANFILDNSTVTPAARARLAAALQGGDPEGGARHLLSTEYAFYSSAFGSKRVGDIWAEIGTGAVHPWRRRALNAVSPFLYNPRATVNLYGDVHADLQGLLARRQFAAMDARVQDFVESHTKRPSFKNVFGQLFASAVPAYSKIFQSYWETQDQRAALLARVTKA